MKAPSVDSFLTQSGEWLRGTGPDADVVVSSRVRLARNLSTHKFLTSASPAERRELEQYVHERLDRAQMPKPTSYFPLHKIAALDKQILLERHLISADHANAQAERGVAVSADEALSIMVCEEDHLRIQALRSGLNLDDAWKEIEAADRALAQVVPYAFHAQYGYLTCCPTNVGTGMRVSVMMHLPAAAFSKQMEKLLQSLSRLNFAVRGFFGEGTQPVGDLFQVSNQVTLGKSEGEILEEMKRIVPDLIGWERTWRRKLMEDQPNRLKDKVWRAFGILRHAYTISSEETLELISALRLGANIGIIDGIKPELINEMFIFSQPAHLQKSANRVLEPAERDALRASYVRQRLRSIAT